MHSISVLSSICASLCVYECMDEKTHLQQMHQSRKQENMNVVKLALVRTDQLFLLRDGQILKILNPTFSPAIGKSEQVLNWMNDCQTIFFVIHHQAWLPFCGFWCLILRLSEAHKHGRVSLGLLALAFRSCIALLGSRPGLGTCAPAVRILLVQIHSQFCVWPTSWTWSQPFASVCWIFLTLSWAVPPTLLSQDFGQKGIQFFVLLYQDCLHMDGLYKQRLTFLATKHVY